MKLSLHLLSRLAVGVSLLFGGEALAQVQLNEIMYNPEGDDAFREYVELYNRGDTAVDLDGWQIGDDGGFDTLHFYPDTVSTSLLPGHYALVLEMAYFTDGGGFYDSRIPDSTLILVVEDAAIGSGGLLNSISETVRLVDSGGDTVNTRSYRPNAEGGQSEERIDPAGGEGDDNWAFSTPGGTPGYFNSVSPVDEDLELTGFTAYSGGISPGGQQVVYVDVVVRNSGLLASGFDRRLQLEATAVGEITPAWIDSIELTALAPEEVYPVQFEGVLAPGEYTVGAHLDPPDDRPANDTLSGTFSLPRELHDLVISEVMPAPPDRPDVEWFELVNRTEDEITLAGWTLTDEAGNDVALDSTASPLGPGEYALVAEDSSMLEWPVLPLEVNLIVPRGWASLNNGGDSLSLFDPSGALIDTARYPKAREGVSLQRLFDGFGKALDLWAECPLEAGGTPGEVNPELPASGRAESVTVTVTPEVISADGDGRDDSVVFQLRFPATTVTISLRLFDRIGRQVGMLLDGETIPGIYDWEWDGREGLDRSGLPVGIYVWHVRAEAPDGRSFERRGTLVSAGY